VYAPAANGTSGRKTVSGARLAGRSGQKLMDAALLTEAALDRGAMQKPSELRALIELLQGERLTRVVEIGSARGGTLLVWCRLAAPDATIVSVDLPGGPFGHPDQAGVPALGSLARSGQELHLLRMDSGWDGTRREVERLFHDEPIDLLFIDGDHTYYGVRTDFLLYAPLVRDGGLVVFHDINSSSSDPAVEVNAVWQQLKRTYEWQEIIHHDPPPTFGGFGILRWSARQEIAAIDPAPDGTGFVLPDLSAEPVLEPVVDVETTVGPLLLPSSDSVITSALRR
jgi:predicted O-methyltransferase YrrM